VPAAAIVVYRKYCKTRKRKLVFVAALAIILFAPVPECRRVSRY
jgi:hypothetical protein